MLETPQLIRTTPLQVAATRLTIPREQMRTVMSPALAELKHALAEQGITPSGPWCCHHFRRDEEAFDFELCFPVSVEVAPAGRVHSARLPSVHAARTVWHGGYEGLPGAWGEFMRWIRAHGHTPADDFRETYLVGPGSGTGPETWQTELCRPLRESEDCTGQGDPVR